MSEWYCPQCKINVDGRDVTFQERHDPRSGGCGGEMWSSKDDYESSVADLTTKLAEAEARLRELREAVEEVIENEGFHITTDGADTLIAALAKSGES